MFLLLDLCNEQRTDREKRGPSRRSTENRFIRELFAVPKTARRWRPQLIRVRVTRGQHRCNPVDSFRKNFLVKKWANLCETWTRSRCFSILLELQHRGGTRIPDWPIRLPQSGTVFSAYHGFVQKEVRDRAQRFFCGALSSFCGRCRNCEV